MATDTKSALAQRANGVPSAAKQDDPAASIAHYLRKMAPEIARAIPKHLDPDRLARIALTTIRANPALLRCDMRSLLGAIMQAAQLGLEPGLLGHCYLVPYKSDVQFVIGYKGMLDLARRSGEIKMIYAQLVYANDDFDYCLGLHPDLRHKPAPTDRGDVIGGYLVAHYKDGGEFFHYLTLEEINKRRDRSPARSNGPWVTDTDAMRLKTVVRDAFRWLPVSTDIQRQIESDETVKRELAEDMTEVPSIIDISAAEEMADEGGVA